jgi:hypothetical protein
MIEQGSGVRNAYLLGSGFWRWHFMLAEDRVYREGWQSIIRNLIRWLSIPDGSSGSNVLISTDKRSYQVGEIVHINSEVYDGDYLPVDSGMVQFKISGPPGIFELDGGLAAPGTYASDFQLLSEGDYTISARAWRSNDVPLGQASTRIVCTAVNIEFINTRRYVNESDYRNIIPDLNFPVRYQEETRTFKIWQKAVLLLLIILLLSVEWFIRKRLGLA